MKTAPGRAAWEGGLGRSSKERPRAIRGRRAVPSSIPGQQAKNEEDQEAHQEGGQQYCDEVRWHWILEKGVLGAIPLCPPPHKNRPQKPPPQRGGNLGFHVGAVMSVAVLPVYAPFVPHVRSRPPQRSRFLSSRFFASRNAPASLGREPSSPGATSTSLPLFAC